MKFYFYFLLMTLLGLASAPAQWVTRSYPLVTGWNGIWLAGDASYTTVADLFAAYPAVTEVWRWNPNADQTNFVQTPSEPTTASDEWTVWKRNDSDEQLLSRMVANSSYLIRSTAAATLSVKQLVVPPTATWLISGANFLGFPSASGSDITPAPTLSRYLASYPSASTTVLATTTKIYKYIGGELGPGNPLRVAPGTETLEKGKAYWFNVATVGNFTAPVEYEVASSAGLAFGRTQAVMSVGITNRSTTSLTLTVALGASESAPGSQPAVSGGVPLTQRVFNSSTNSYTETPMGGSFTVTIAASGRTTLDFGIDRSKMTGTADAFYASILRFTDSAGLSDVSLPVSGQTASTAGLWLMNTQVSQVSQVGSSVGSDSTTPQPFPLLFLAHVDSAGNARLLSEAFVGKLTTTGNPVGICISESRVLGFSASDLKPVRYFASQMPTSITSILGTGAMATGSTLSWVIPILFNDPTNPFVHNYHPDHDNLNAKGEALTAGQESFTINRNCQFTFTADPPDGNYVAGWGTTVLGGAYLESISGLHKQVLQVGGTFRMRRLSEIASIDLTAP